MRLTDGRYRRPLGLLGPTCTLDLDLDGEPSPGRPLRHCRCKPISCETRASSRPGGSAAGIAALPVPPAVSICVSTTTSGGPSPLRSSKASTALGLDHGPVDGRRRHAKSAAGGTDQHAWGPRIPRPALLRRRHRKRPRWWRCPGGTARKGCSGKAGGAEQLTPLRGTDDALGPVHVQPGIRNERQGPGLRSARPPRRHTAATDRSVDHGQSRPASACPPPAPHSRAQPIHSFRPLQQGQPRPTSLS